ncbi:MAG: hypothetical protein HRU34_00105 [Richelia sp.]|nr:hypothetical protein [Richelia sp.]
MPISIHSSMGLLFAIATEFKYLQKFSHVLGQLYGHKQNIVLYDEDLWIFNNSNDKESISYGCYR